MSILTTDVGHCTVPEAVEASGAIAVLRKPDPATVAETVAALLESGVVLIEFTMDDKNAISYIEQYSCNKRCFVGAGTIENLPQARWAVQAGAKFLIGPGFVPEVVRVSREYRVPYFPGCLTYNEMRIATEATGLNTVKLFPASVYGPRGIKHLFGPRSDLQLIVAGYDTLEDGLTYIYAGAAAMAFNPSQFADYERPLVPELIVSQGRSLLEEIKLKKALSKS